MRFDDAREVSVSPRSKTTVPRLLILTALATAAGGFVLVSSGGAGGQGPTCAGEESTHVMGPGDGTYVGTDGRDVVVGSSNNDVIRTLEGADLVCAEAGHDNVNGGRGEDELYGSCGDDVLRGREQEDFLDGEEDFFCLKRSKSGETKRRGSQENDYCLGSKPKPDTEAKHDTAGPGCEHVTSAFEESPGR